MISKTLKSSLLLLYLLTGELPGTESVVATSEVCGGDNDLKQCATRADSLLKDPNLVFPDSQGSVDKVCSQWNEFTECIFEYTKRCLSLRKKSEFERSLHEPINSMSTLCQDKDYRKEYLRYSPCIKKVATENGLCGNHYRFLIDHVSGTNSALKQICCARHKFKTCMLQKTYDKCDKNKKDSYGFIAGKEPNSTAYALKTLDKSLAFITQQCSLTPFREEECPGVDQSSFRPNSKGPILGVELDAAASGAAEKIHSASDHGQNQLNTPTTAKQPVPLQPQQPPKKLPTYKPYESQEKPKTDKLKDQQFDGSKNGGEKATSFNFSFIVFLIFLSFNNFSF